MKKNSTRPNPVIYLLALIVSLLTFRLFYLISLYGVNIFFSDQWDFLGPLFYPVSFWRQLSWQHGPHRMGLGLPIMVEALRWTNGNQNTMAYLNATCFGLSAVVALWLKSRLCQKLTWADLMIPFLFLTTSQWETLITTPNLSHGPLSGLFLLLFLLSLTWPASWWKIVGLLFFFSNALFSGFALFLAPFGIFYFLVTLLQIATQKNQRSVQFKTERQQNLAGLVGTAFFTGLFSVGYRFEPAADCFVFPDPHPIRYLGVIFYSYARASGAVRLVSLQGVMGLITGLGVFAYFLFLKFRFFARWKKYEAADWAIFITGGLRSLLCAQFGG